MKKCLFILFILFQFVSGQNLVPNGSFEVYSECPEVQGDFEVDNWYNVINHSGTADFFNTCSTGLFTVPTNFFGIQNPKDGNAFTGIACFNNFPFELREYLQVELINSLVHNQFYEVSFYVSLADNHRFGLNHIGAALTETAIEGNNTLGHLTITPQVITENIVSDKEGWTKINGVFQADGGESYLTIGVFYSDEELSIIEFPESEYTTGYYFIDSVSITETENPDNGQNCLRILNPVDEIIFLNATNNVESLDIILFDISGKQIKKKIVNNEIYVGDLSSGVYIIHYKCGTEIGYKKIIKI